MSCAYVPNGMNPEFCSVHPGCKTCEHHTPDPPTDPTTMRTACLTLTLIAANVEDACNTRHEILSRDEVEAIKAAVEYITENEQRRAATVPGEVDV